MGASFNDEPNYFFRGVILVGLAVGLFFGLNWLETAEVEMVDNSKIAQFLFRIHLPYFAGALFALLGFVSWVRGLMSLSAHLNSCFITATLGAMVLIVITAVVLFFEYRPDLAAERVAERKAAEDAAKSDSLTPETRVFTSANGRTMRAAFLSFDGKKVWIQREDGKVFTNSIELYSKPDQEYFRAQETRSD